MLLSVPLLRWWQQRDGQLQTCASSYKLPFCSRQCNHEFAGESRGAPDLPAGAKGGGFMVTKNRKKVRDEAMCCACCAVPVLCCVMASTNCTDVLCAVL